MGNLRNAIFMYVTLNTEADKWLTCFKGHKDVDKTFMYKIEGAVLANKRLQNYIKGQENLEKKAEEEEDNESFPEAIDHFEHVGEIFSECLEKIRMERNPEKQQELILLMNEWRNGSVTALPDDTESIMTKSEVIDFVQHITKGSALTKEIIINSYNTFKNDK